jgi:O-antigen ligase
MLTAPGNFSIAPAQRKVLATAATLLLIVPWLNPFAPGPSPSVVPWLVSLFCGALLLLLSRYVTVQVICRAWLTAALVSAGVGVLQYMGWAQALAPWVNQTSVGEAYGNLRQRNQFASLMSIGLAVLIWRCASGRTGQAHQRILVIAAAALLGLATAASVSRTGLLQLVVLGALGVVWGLGHKPGARALFIAAAAANLAGSLALPMMAGLDPGSFSVLGRMGDNSAPCSSRITLWSNVLHLIAQKPWTGWGWGELDYAHFVTLYPGARFCDILDNAHNLPLQLAVELGIPVALLVCGAALWLVLRARPWRETSPVRQLAWSVMLVIGVHSMLEYPLWYGPFMTAFVLCMLMLWLHPAGELERDVDGDSQQGTVRASAALTSARIGAGVALLCLLVYVSWDYRRVSQIYTAPEAREPAYRDDTLNKVRASWLFADQVVFAELTTAPVTRANARAMYAMAQASLHYSPEPAVVERLIESAVMLGLDDEALADLARFKAAFPKEHADWAQANLRAVQLLRP